MLPCLTLSGYMADQTWPYYLSLAGVSGHLAWQVIIPNFSVIKSFFDLLNNYFQTVATTLLFIKCCKTLIKELWCY